ncbi:MAG: hypothetical protein JWP18_236 [Solirubrobacterales bacterium]|nr:hypothetical protein [Solirubrobacterales bacterium]
MLTHRMIRRTSLAALSCLAAAVAASACGSNDDNNDASSSPGAATSNSTAGSGAYGGAGSTAKSGSSTTAASGTIRLQADASGALAFDHKTLTTKAGKVTLEMLNPSASGLPHAIAVDGNGVDQDGKTVDPGGTSTVAVTLKPGTYTFYCPVPGHEAGGMKGTLTVR